MKPISFTSFIGLLKHLKGMHYIEIPDKIVKKIGGIGKQRLICEVNKTLSFQCGLVALGEGKAYITISNQRMKTLHLKLHDEVFISLTKDDSEYGMEMPEELAELFKQDDEGKRRFDLLTAGKQRYILQYVASVKSVQLRVDRAFLLISNLKQLPLGKESFREMLGK